MAKSKVEKTLRDSLSTINELRRELKKVRKAGEHAVAQQFEKATSSSAAEIKKLRDEVDRVRETTSKQIADLTAVVARLAPDVLRPSSDAPVAEPTPPPAAKAAPGESGSDRPHGDPLREAAAGTKSRAAKKAPAKKASAKKAPAKKATVTPAEAATDERLSLAGEALAASQGVSPVDQDAPGTVPAAATTTKATPAKKAPVKKTAAKKTAAKKTAAKKAPAKKAPTKTPGAKSTAKRGGSGGQKTTARKAPASKATTAPRTPAPKPDNPAVADRPAAD